MSNKSTNILLVEDNAGDVQLVKFFLKDAAFKYELFCAETLHEAFEQIQNRTIDLVLLDLSLPDSQGFKTLGRFIEKVPHLPVVVMTGINNEIIGNQAIRAGAQDFLVKGQFEGRLLGRVIRYSLQRFRDKQKLEEEKRELMLTDNVKSKVQQIIGFGNWELDIVSQEMTWTDEVFRIFGMQPYSYSTGVSDYMRLVHHEDREHVENFFDDVAKNANLQKIEHRVILDGVSIKWVSLQGQLFFEEMTQRTLIVGGVLDITERKLNEQLIIEQNIHRQTVSLKDEVLSDMSFHIRTPLSSIVNLLYLLDNVNATTQQREYLDGIKTSVDDLSLMVNNLLNFSTLVSQNLRVEEEELRIKEFLDSIEKILRIKANAAKIRLDFELPSNLPDKIIADAKKITQIAYNLIDYATRYSLTASSIIFKIGTEEQERPKNSHILRQPAFCNIVMKHAARGITVAQLHEMLTESKILDSFHQDNDDFQKKNIGLAIVNKLVRLLNGTLNIQQQSADWILFEVRFPIGVIRLHNQEMGKPTEPVKILLVEDHYLNQMATRRLLTAWSPFVTVDIAENGLVAVEKFREHGYDLVLMDLQMPIMNGFDATVRIRERSEVPIIALSASANKSETDRCREIGMNDYISKPFKANELYSKISAILLSKRDSKVA